jgi:hypothetical protein
VFYQQRQRKTVLNDLGITNILPNEGELQTSFQRYGRDYLDQGHIYHLADKEDVAFILSHVFQEAGQDFGGFGLDGLLSEIDMFTYVDEWKEAFKR